MKPVTHGMSRRSVLLAGGASLWSALPSPAFATESEVSLAILQDFGQADAPLGNIEIDMPEYSDSGKSVPISVTVPCSMQGLDYPATIAVYAEHNPRPRIMLAEFTPISARPTFSTRVRINSYQDVTVVVKMATGAVFKAVRKVDVTYGACEEAVANDQFPPGWAPRIRVAVPQSVVAGGTAEIRAIIGHPMETGLRHNATGLLVPVRITERFRCYANGNLAFSVKLEPAIAANPYLGFFLKIDGSTEIAFEWFDTSGDIYTEKAMISAT
jgi:predicted secreted protein